MNLNWIRIGTCNDEFGGVPDGALSVLSGAGVVADVLLAEVGDAQFGTVVGDGQRRRRRHQLVLPQPQNLRDRRPFGQAAQDDRVSQTHVDHLLRRQREMRWRCMSYIQICKYANIQICKLAHFLLSGVIYIVCKLAFNTCHSNGINRLINQSRCCNVNIKPGDGNK